MLLLCLLYKKQVLLFHPGTGMLIRGVLGGMQEPLDLGIMHQYLDLGMQGDSKSSCQPQEHPL